MIPKGQHAEALPEFTGYGLMRAAFWGNAALLGIVRHPRPAELVEVVPTQTCNQTLPTVLF